MVAATSSFNFPSLAIQRVTILSELQAAKHQYHQHSVLRHDNQVLLWLTQPAQLHNLLADIL